jgi:hypothetical protein
VPWLPNVGQWDARAAFRAQSFAGAVWVTTDGELVHQFNGAKVPVGAGSTALGNVHSARSSPRLQPEAPMARSPGWVLTERFVGGNIKQAPRGSAPQPARASFFTGNAPIQANNLPSYGQIELGEVFPGVSVALKATNANVEKLFTVAPGRDPNAIRMAIDGASALSIGRDGSLIATTGNGDIAFTAPIAFQENDQGERVMVDVAYRLVGADAAALPLSVGADLAALSGAHPSDAKSSPTDRATTYTFTLGDYDTTRPLIIDPLLASTYLGGGNSDQIRAIAVHPHTGQVYVAGETDSPSFPQSGGGAQTSATGISCFVSRYSADLQQLLQSTYLGNGGVRCNAIAFHPGSGAVYVAGEASGTATFPAGSTTGAIQPSNSEPGDSGTFDGFVALLTADLRTLTRATFFGGVSLALDVINAIAVHPHTGFVHVVGTTTTTSGLPGVVMGTPRPGGTDPDAFTARLPVDLLGPANATVRHAFIRGNGFDFGYALAIDPRSGDLFMAGVSDGGLPTTMLSGAAQTVLNGPENAFIARLKQDLSSVVRATYLGGNSRDTAYSLAVHPFTGELIVAGTTNSSDFPQRANGAQSTYGEGADGFVSRLSPDLTAILQSTYLGGTQNDCSITCQVAVHPLSGEIFVLGDTEGLLPASLVADGYQGTPGRVGPYDAFIVRLNAALTARRAGTYLGGDEADTPYGLAIAPDGGSVYVAGRNDGGSFPTVNAQQGTFSGDRDGFVSRLSTDLTAVNRTPNPFSFIHQSNVPPNSTRTSNEVRLTITPTPPNNQQAAYVTGANGSELCIATQPGVCVTPYVGCASPCFSTGWFPGPWDFLSGDYIAVRHTSAASGTAETKLIISGSAYPFRTSTGNANFACNLDMNASNTLTPPDEGLILVRAMLGFTGNAVVNGTSVTPAAWDQLRPAINTHCGTNFR